MGIITMHFLFNLSLLMILFFVFFLLDKRVGSIHLHKRAGLFYFVFSLVICTVFSYPIQSGYVLDLRIIPFLLGGLYLRFSPILGFLVILFRAFHGIDVGFFIAVAFYTVFSFFIWYISPWFLKLTSNIRILFSTGITLLISVGILFTIALNKVSPDQFIDIFIAYVIVPPLGVAIISSTIEIREKNQQLEQQLVIEEKMAAVEQMGAAISHEIRNPLTTAIGFIELLDQVSLDNNKRTKYISIIKDELDSAEGIIQDYLTFSKPIIESIEELDIQNELTHILKLLHPLANYHSVKVSTDFSTYGTIQGDRSKFHQCFINIIRNSIESMPYGGALLIKTIATQNKITISIQDTGTGLSKDQINHLGEPHYSPKGPKGTGLSMMVAYSILRAMKGTIEVQSEIGKGTISLFHFKLHKTKV
ncbi:sensor histidine kinase [Psychrobacillus psychrodurans]|uniref:sensor histidine kinase n=1 Tax=Psychrobacillus psychrodurans TaxID=126157 RepID=UPI0008EF8642|nr:HAMP domain-containing sensor histidine kinase [Psychrobacillus psychrodurans]MCZ8542407.1 HAMP domain-containing histidine kinase [Psychrobacillus psychrodurans]SFN21997.1 two-component system, sporulation sensor kinase B [Psychrobacillus psychrodurans]